jgi:molybdopterin synthase sulfur carrier subunit
MAVKIRIPLTIRRLTDDQELVEVEAITVGGAIEAMHRRYHGIRERLMDERGRVRPSVLVFVNDENIRFLENERTPLKDGDEISIVPAFAGG